MNERVKKSLEKSKNLLEEKRKIVKQKICIKKDTHDYNNCYELHSRAINYIQNFMSNFNKKKELIKKVKIVSDKSEIK